MADYLHVYEIFEERLLPFIRQMVEFFSTGRIPRQPDEPPAEDKNDLGTPSAGQSTPVSSVLKRIDDKLQELSPRSKLSSTSSEAAAASSTGLASSATVATTSQHYASTANLSASASVASNGATSDDVFAGAVESLPACQYYGENLGKIQVAVLYDSRQMILTLKIIQASELAAKDFSGTSDPYVKILLLPDKRNKLTTKVKRKNLNPRWNETFLFEGFPYTKLLNRTIYLQVLDYDRFSRDDPIGEVTLPLCELQLSTSGQTMWKSLEPCKGHHGILGELLVSLNYKPSHGVMTVGILKARNLKAKDINGQSDPYVKIWLMFDGKRVEKRKTVVKEKCLNPTFEESFPFLVSCDKIRQTSLFISVMDYDRMGRNELIGQVLLGSKSGPMEIKHWNEMFSKCKSDVKRWHMLKSFS